MRKRLQDALFLALVALQGRVRTLLAKRAHLKRVPQLQFVRDTLDDGEAELESRYEQLGREARQPLAPADAHATGTAAMPDDDMTQLPPRFQRLLQNGPRPTAPEAEGHRPRLKSLGRRRTAYGR